MTATPPALGQIKAYLGADHSWSDADIASAYAAEVAAQVARVKLPADVIVDEVPVPQPYPADLAEALCRRVAHNLALRALPLAIQTSITDVGASAVRLQGSDPEVQRLERPYRKLAVG